MSPDAVPNVTAAVPLLMVANIERSFAFYVNGLGFSVDNRWEPDGRLRWCWMSLGGAALMLQEAADSTREKMRAAGVPGNGVALYFQCRDALAVYREAAARGVNALHEPQVGNFAWEVFSPIPTDTKSISPAPRICPKKRDCRMSRVV